MGCVKWPDRSLGPVRYVFFRMDAALQSGRLHRDAHSAAALATFAISVSNGSRQ